MSGQIGRLPPLGGSQALAADPSAHAALSASAGTGKTHVLTARVLRLLLGGARPESILCLTFTKAAAAEMANRIGARLAAWVRLKRSELWTDLENLGERPDDALIERARQLFARVLDCPGGLRIQTIHAFAQGLLAAFPAEAGVSPGFQPIEGRAEQELVRRTLADLMADAEARADAQLVADVQCLSRRLGEAGAVEYLQACARKSSAMEALGDPAGIDALVRRAMRLPEEPVSDYLERHCDDEGFDCDLLHAVAATNRAWDTKEGREHVERIERWLKLPAAERAAQLPDLALLVFTKSDEPRKVRPGQIKLDTEYERHVSRLAESIGALVQVQREALLAADIGSGLRAGRAFAAAYTRAKRAAGVADFNDLIDWTRRLLATEGMGDWVRYKLDRQVDHVLVDEAQDTNSAQWEIVRALVAEFFTGSSEAEQRHRTLFMVGDLKQAIYGFQGTDPRRFEEARKEFRQRAADLAEAERDIDPLERRAREFRDLSIAASFRSAQPVLDVVDAMIATVGPEALALAEPPPPHRAHHAERAGEVELWPPFSVESDPDASDEGEERWVVQRDRDYARALADRIAAMIAEGPVLPSTGRPLGAGDILVLVRSRGQLASLIVARLFSAGVPVAGVDRLHLHEPLAVQDLLAAVRFAVQPDDDLSLACLLVSPLIGWDQDQLRALAHGRQVSLWRELRRRAAEFSEAHDALAGLLRIADFTTPSQFLEAILSGPLEGRRKLYSRLGLAARDAVDELMNSALEFERGEIASLDRFLSWFSRGTVDVQRDPGRPSNEVRVMTVHGAKGLEAPVVILADATADPRKLGRTPISIGLDLNGEPAPVVRPRKDERCWPFEERIVAEERRDLEEHLRLLYVALTRASDRLIVGGVMPKARSDGGDPRPANSWHRVVEAAMVSIGAEAGDNGSGLRFGGIGRVERKRSRDKADQAGMVVPEWVRQAAPVEARPPRPLAPSAIASDGEAAPPPTPAMREAALRGTWIHALLERLPAVAPDEREQAARRWLERSAGVADGAAREEIVGQVCSILSDRPFASLFGPASLGEAPLAATLADGRVIAGTVDRLLIDDESVAVIDFKTGRVPASDDEVPASHRAQMRAYAEALKVIFPGRKVCATLLYTSGPKLVQVMP